MFFQFIGNNKQHMPVCMKIISSWASKVLSISKAYMFLGTLHDALSCTALAPGVSLVSILEAGDLARVSTTAKHYFLVYITAKDWHMDSVQHALLGLSE